MYVSRGSELRGVIYINMNIVPESALCLTSCCYDLLPYERVAERYSAVITHSVLKEMFVWGGHAGSRLSDPSFQPSHFPTSSAGFTFLIRKTEN